MPLGKMLIDPNTINKIDPVDAVLLTPPNPLPATGYRVLVADPSAGTSTSGTATAAFANKLGMVAVLNAANTWEFEDGSNYLADQPVIVKGNNDVWIYWKASNTFVKSSVTSTDEQSVFDITGGVWQYYKHTTTANAAASTFTLSNGKLMVEAGYIPASFTLQVEINTGEMRQPGDGFSTNARMFIETDATTKDVSVGIQNQPTTMDSKPAYIAVYWVEPAKLNPTAVPQKP